LIFASLKRNDSKMRIFVNDKPLDLISYEGLDSSKSFESEYFPADSLPSQIFWEDDLLIHEPSQDLIIELLYALRTRKLKKLDSITLVTKDKAGLKKFVKSRFLTIRAAGGIVTKKDKILLIFRLGKWDFPKGKFEKGETPIQCALREVEEECAIKVKAGKPIITTWHTYTQNRKSILKKTYWFQMESVHDEKMTPQKEEGIEDVRWFYEGDAKVALVNSYPSMRYLFKNFIKSHHKTQSL
jgi:8-oxo-dGTP pyrophosphatase MutT (NUDIX family)